MLDECFNCNLSSVKNGAGLWNQTNARPGHMKDSHDAAMVCFCSLNSMIGLTSMLPVRADGILAAT